MRQITGPHLIICEGTSDERFFERLCESRGLSGFQFLSPSEKERTGSGNSSVGNVLSALLVRSEDLAKLRSIVVVLDNDDDCAAAFQLAQKHRR
jgi:hypothetical protein